MKHCACGAELLESFHKSCKACFVKMKREEQAVLESSLVAKQSEASALKAKISTLEKQLKDRSVEYYELRNDMNDLRKQLSSLADPGFLKRLIRLTHPDRHDGSREANDVTAVLVGLWKKT